jgi:hypothetical protein
MKRIKPLAWILAAVMAIGPLLFTGCGVFNPPYRDSDGYYAVHYSCCGPQALGRAFDMSYQRDGIIFLRRPHSEKEISRFIQDRGQKSKVFLSYFSKSAVCITWPSEIKAAAKRYGFTPITLGEMDKLDPKKDVAVILVRGSTLKGEWHWVCFPYYNAESIKKYYGEKTKIEKIYLLSGPAHIFSGDH